MSINEFTYKGDRKHALIPSLVSHDASASIDFYKKVFDAKETSRFNMKDKIAHAELVIDDTTIMIADEMFGPWAKSAKTIGDTPISLYVYMKSVDETVKKAVALGAKLFQPVKDEFWGDRTGIIVDPFGFKWCIATHIKQVDMDKMKSGLNEMMGQKGGSNFQYKYMKYKHKYQFLKHN